MGRILEIEVLHFVGLDTNGPLSNELIEKMKCECQWKDIWGIQPFNVRRKANTGIQRRFEWYDSLPGVCLGVDKTWLCTPFVRH